MERSHFMKRFFFLERQRKSWDIPKLVWVAPAIKTFFAKYSKHRYNRTTINSCKIKLKSTSTANVVFRKSSRPFPLNDSLINL